MIPLDQDGRGLTEGEIEALRRFVDEKGLGPAADELELTRETVARLLAKLPVQRTTVARVRERLEKEGKHGRTDEGTNQGGEG